MGSDGNRQGKALAGCVVLVFPQIVLLAVCVAIALSQGKAWLGFLAYAVGEGMIGLLLFTSLMGGGEGSDE